MEEAKVQKQIKMSYWDKLGISLSGACAIHCVVASFAFLLPSFALAGLPELEIFHWFLFFFILPVALWSFVSHRRQHKKNAPLFLGSLGVFFLALSLLAHDHAFLEKYELYFSLFGSALLISAHYLNYHFFTLTKKSCPSCS